MRQESAYAPVDGASVQERPRARVLFVDDESNVLAGLRRSLRAGGMLRSAQHDLELLFADSGPSAITIQETEPVDVIVSDMQMPGMDGPELLSEVQRRWPGTARIVLSGHADKKAVLAAARCAQQFLAKPCDTSMLIGVIERVLASRRTLSDPALHELIGTAVTLPALPEVYDELIEAMGAPDPTLRDISRIISGDLGISAEVLRMVNSAFFGLGRTITTVDTAVSLLGAENIKALVLTGALFRVSDPVSRIIDVQGLQNAALRRSSLTRAIGASERWDQELVGACGLAALLRDISMLLLAEGMPDATRQLLAEQPKDADPRVLAELEHASFGCTVPQASAYLLDLWSFSPLVVHLVASQPVPLDAQAEPTSEMAIDVAHRRTLRPDAHVTAEEVGYLPADRLDLWNQCCDTKLVED